MPITNLQNCQSKSIKDIKVGLKIQDALKLESFRTTVRNKISVMRISFLLGARMLRIIQFTNNIIQYATNADLALPFHSGACIKILHG